MILWKNEGRIIGEGTGEKEENENETKEVPANSPKKRENGKEKNKK